MLRNNRLPRVTQTRQRLEAITEEPTIYLIGTVTWKKIGQALQQGTVTRYNEDREYYWINYKNGDSEEMTHWFVTKYKCVKPNTIQRSSEQIQQQQVNATTRIPVITTIPQHFAHAVYDEETGKMMEMCNFRNHPNPTIRKEWECSVSNEYGWLMKEIGMKRKGKSWVQGFHTFHFIHKNQIPKGRKITYARFCCDVRPQKKKKKKKKE